MQSNTGMTVTEMQLAIRLELDKSTALTGSVDFLPEELDFWLQEGQERFIKQRMFGTNSKQQSFDQTQKRIDDLRSLIVQTGKINLSSSTFGTNIKEGTLPITDGSNPYLFYIMSDVYDVSSNELHCGKVISFSEVSNYIKDFINNPWFRRPIVFFYENSVDKIAFIYPDEFIPVQCTITYIKKPRVLVSGTPTGYQTNTCELPAHTHKEIVALTVGLLIENIESPRIQTFTPLNESKIE